MESYDKEDEEWEGEEDKEEAIQLQLPAKLKDKKKMKNKDPGIGERGKNIHNILGPMGKLHNNVIHICKLANHITWFKDCAGKIIPLDNCTRWNSWFTMLSIALEDKVKAGLQLYVEHYQDNILKDNILIISK
jgi:hypothetical protein